jgi:hypothetical protein
MWNVCYKDEICKGTDSPQVTYRVDYTSKYSLHNWVQQYNLICSKDYLVGAIGSLYFAGWASFALILPAKAE